MSWLDKARKVAKKATRPIARPLERVLKPIAQPLRPVVSKAVPFIPFVAPLALVAKAKTFGIKSERGVAGYRRSQKVARIGTAAVAGYVAAPAVGAAATSLGGAIKGGALALGAGVSSIFARVKGAGQALGVDDMEAVAKLVNPLVEGGGDLRGGTLANDPRTGGGGGWGGDLPPAPSGGGVPAWGWAAVAGLGVVGVLFLVMRR